MMAAAEAGEGGGGGGGAPGGALGGGAPGSDLGGGGGGSAGAAFRWQQPAWFNEFMSNPNPNPNPVSIPNLEPNPVSLIRFNEFMCRVWLRARHDVSRRMQRKLAAALRDGAPLAATCCPLLPP